MKDQKGYTLILVLIIITLIMMFSLSLSGMAINTNLQINKSEEINKATDLAEMGITYYLNIVQNAIITAKNNSENKPSTNFCKELKKQLDNPSSTYYSLNTVDGPNNFKIAFLSFDKSCDSNPTNFKIFFDSKGFTKKDDTTLDGVFTIAQADRTGETAPTKSNFNEYESDPIVPSGQQKEIIFTSSLYADNILTINGNKGVSVKGNAFFAKTVTMHGATSELYVNGDAYFVDSFPHNFSGSVCITGETYKVDSNKKISSFSIPENTCGKSSKQWKLDPQSGIKVEY